MAYLELKNIHFSYSDRHVLCGLNLVVKEKERIFIGGENGSGKSTLFRCITGLEKIDSGEIFFAWQKIAREQDFIFLRRSVGYILQNSEDQLFFPIVINDVGFGPLNLGLGREAAEQKALDVLKMLGIGHLANRNSSQLSGGEQKLVAIAAILAMQPAILLLDEPFNGLDRKKAQNLLSILLKLDCAMLIAAHDQDYVSALHARPYLLEEGSLQDMSGANFI